MPSYALASHVFACLDDEHIVLLDLKQDRYFSFPAAGARGLEAIVAGWPASRAMNAAAAPDGERIARRLIQQGLLDHAGVVKQAMAPSAISKPTMEMVSDRYEDSPCWRLSQIAAFVAALCTATILLRCGSLERAVRRVQRRRASARASAAAFDIERTRALLAVFAALRPFLFTSRDACLFESLVLIEFLARHEIFPGWAFGVRARPFAAHCWVQHGDTALNDTTEHLARYTPIMAV